MVLGKCTRLRWTIFGFVFGLWLKCDGLLCCEADVDSVKVGKAAKRAMLFLNFTRE